MNLQENIQRIKQVMGLLTEEENQPATKGVNHGVVIKQPYLFLHRESIGLDHIQLL